METKIIYNNDQNLSFKAFLSKAFGYVALGLLVSTVCAFLISFNLPSIVNTIGANTFYVGSIVLLFAELGIAVYFSSKLMTMSKTSAYICFFLYSAITGITLSTVLLTYAGSDVLMAFASTTLLFICMSIIGNTTSIDLTKYSSYFLFGLIGIMIATFINMFIGSYTVDLIISYIAVVLFLGLIAYDMQRMKQLYDNSLYDNELNEKLLIFGAFQLYLDFINLFLRILQIFSRRNRRN